MNSGSEDHNSSSKGRINPVRSISANKFVLRKTSVEQAKKTFNIMFGSDASRDKLTLFTQKQTPTVGFNEY